MRYLKSYNLFENYSQNKTSEKESSKILKSFKIDTYIIKSVFDDYLDLNSDMNIEIYIDEEDSKCLIVKISTDANTDGDYKKRISRWQGGNYIPYKKYMISDNIIKSLNSQLDDYDMFVNTEPVEYFDNFLLIRISHSGKIRRHAKKLERDRLERLRRQEEHERYLEEIRCKTCDGNGFVECEKCDATGYLDSEGEEVCDECYGDAGFICPECGGSGEVLPSK